MTQFLVIIDPKITDTIDDVASQLTLCADSSGCLATCSFNGVVLIVEPDTPASAVVKFYFLEESKRLSKERIGSLEGQNAIFEARVKAGVKIDELMLRLPTLDFTNLAAIIDWLCELEESTRYGNKYPWQYILAVFQEHGFTPNMNTGTDFEENDKINHAGCIIGFALNCLLYEGIHAVHQTIHDHAKKWRQKFL